MADGTSMIFFRPAQFDLAEAGRLLAANGFSVTRSAARLRVRWGDGPMLSIAWSADPHVAVEAAEIGEGTPFAAELRRCTTRFEIHTDDLVAALDEINTLIEVQLTLQQTTRGILFNSWNGELSGANGHQS